MRSARLKCPFCGRDPVPERKGRIASHLSPGGVKCIGIGWSATQARAHRALIEQKG